MRMRLLEEILYTLLSNVYPISGYLIVGSLFLVLAGLLYTFSELQLNLWHRMWLPIDVVHQQIPPATDTVRDGVVGCLLGVPARILQWVSFFLGLDLILLQGRATLWLGETIGII